MHIALGAKMKSQGPSFPYYLYPKKDQNFIAVLGHMLGLIKYGNETDLWRMWDCLVGYLDLDHNEDALSKRDKR